MNCSSCCMANSAWLSIRALMVSLSWGLVELASRS